MSSQQLLTITNIDSLPGYALAFRLAEHRDEVNIRLRGMCRDRKGLEDLEKQGVEIVQVDYRDENKVQQGLQDSRCVFLVPEQSEDRVQEAECVIRAAKQAKIEHMAMLSWIGVDAMQQNVDTWGAHLQQYQQIEQRLKQSFGDNHCIVRSTLFSQFFYYVTPMVEQHNALCLPANRDKRWGTVDLRDVVEAIFNLVRKNVQIGRGQKQLYNFTPKRMIDAQEMARGMAEAVERRHEDLKYQQIDRNEMWEYLKRIRDDDRFRERHPGGTEKPYTIPLGRYLTETCIATLMDFFELVNRGKAHVESHDLQELLGREPQSLHEYFKNNRDQFKRFR